MGNGAGTVEGDEHDSWTGREALHAPTLGAGRGRRELNTPSYGVRSRQGGGRRRCGCEAHARVSWGMGELRGRGSKQWASSVGRGSSHGQAVREGSIRVLGRGRTHRPPSRRLRTALWFLRDRERTHHGLLGFQERAQRFKRRHNGPNHSNKETRD
ncbi:hypothetical protein GUJ93_ZPchr0765g33698 [Zizania palustris]|uniref:Uncharacterized protein n=1 Tax=Zizania palustris TaxID=103762 RepID=A0A8J5REY5_ZIZPA|nr:hypothetical protein GUJ93_ZPchr0765g33698 [Zizania palustris]